MFNYLYYYKIIYNYIIYLIIILIKSVKYIINDRFIIKIILN